MKFLTRLARRWADSMLIAACDRYDTENMEIATELAEACLDLAKQDKEIADLTAAHSSLVLTLIERTSERDRFRQAASLIDQVKANVAEARQLLTEAREAETATIAELRASIAELAEQNEQLRRTRGTAPSRTAQMAVYPVGARLPSARDREDIAEEARFKRQQDGLGDPA